MGTVTGVDPSAAEVPGVGTGPLLVVTPEELDLLERAHAAHLGLDPQPEPLTEGADLQRREGARDEALRSLQGRGLLDAHGRLVEDQPLAELVLLLLDVRLGARALLVVERRLAGAEDRPDLRLLHLIEAGGVVEDQHHTGWHGLNLCLEPSELADRALAPVLPPDAVAGQGEAMVLDLGDPDAAAARLRASVLAELTLVRPEPVAGAEPGPGSTPEVGPEESVLLAVGEHGCHLARPGTGTDGEVGGPVFEPVTPGDVRDLVGGWVERVVEPVAPDGIP
ncbi:hypothetical protein BJF80_11145 [Serinicoccus sp. CUA-874]|uniref:hypothetical protein n=1 Tax=Serinicoccus sp. CUA-874 TaxID=1517939 RepID=UPI000967C4DF|nr:hypothetical protein [Serinicoccus sp. CUA-874]OLT14932.1 hypothetical protein BJF80_11145 [Serinicoccus sp. CUA-874]